MLNSGSTRSPHEADMSHALLRHGVRQLAVLRATSAGIACAPTLDDSAGSIERTREVLLALERCAERYASCTGASLLAEADRLLGELLTPSSWVDATRAQLLLCLATQVELTQARAQGDTDPHALAALASATEHVHAARAALQESGAFQPLHTDPTASSARWLSLALGTLPDEHTRAAYMQALEQTSCGFAH